MGTQTAGPVIVVGVDGSPSSKDALRWAARYAELTGAPIHALIAWQLPEIYGYTPRDFEGDARQTSPGPSMTPSGPAPATSSPCTSSKRTPPPP